MSKPLKVLGIVAGAVAVVATAGAALGLGFAAGALGLAASGTVISGTTIAGIAGLVAGVANIGSQALAKPPPARGSVTQMLIASTAAQPYVMGEGFYAGVLRHRTGYGGTVDGVENPYLFDAVVYSGGGPVESIEPRIDYGAVPSWYSGFLFTDAQLGATPEADALAPHWSGTPGWTSAHKLSGQAAIGWSFKFDKAGKKFASGLPLTGAYGQWVRVYDPRLDSTFPGGSGAHRLGDETTYEWSANPALHAGTYAFGRYQNGVRTMGIGLPEEAIDWAVVAAWASVCEANDWTMFGVVYEPGDRWANLKDICAAGGGEPVPGGQLTFRYWSPAVAIDTITIADAGEQPESVVAMQSYRDRINTIIPKFTSPDHNWELVQGEAVTVSGYLTEDGEERPQEWPFNFVTSADQATQLAAYRLTDARELHPIELVCGPRLRTARPGECYHIDRPDLGLDTDAIVLRRQFDPATMTVALTLIGETPSKHAFALGISGTAPATPALGQTPEERDTTAAGGADRQVIVEVVGLKKFDADYAGVVVSGQLPANLVPAVTLGGADVHLSDDVGYAIATSGVTASVNDTDGDPDKGTITITAVDSLDGFIDLTVTIGGVAQPAKRIVIQKQVGLASGLGGSGSKIANDNSFATVSTTSYAAITDTLTVTLAGGESLYGTAPLNYYVEPGSFASRNVEAKWQYSPAGAGTWSDFAASIVGSSATADVEPGYGEFTHSKSGLSAGDYDVRLMAKLSASGLFVGFSGTATIEAKV